MRLNECIDSEIYHIQYAGHNYIGKYNKTDKAFNIIKILSGHTCNTCARIKYNDQFEIDITITIFNLLIP